MEKANDIQLSNHLKNVPLFSILNTRQLDILYKAGLIGKYPKGSIIVQQNASGDTFHIVISGRAKVTLLNEDGKEIVLAVLKEGDFFGELSLLDNEPRSASVITVNDATVFSLTRPQFYQLITARPDILKKVLKVMCARLRDADEKIGSLAFLDVYGRTIRILQQLAHDQGIKTRYGIEILNAPTHQELSGMVGASREAITRIIKILKENKNLASYEGRKFILREQPNIPLPQ